jgi:hypothetical protein
MVPYANGQVRAVTHHGVTTQDVDRVVEAVDGALRDTAAIPA